MIETGSVLSLLRSEGWFVGSLTLLAAIVVADLVTPDSSLAAACAVTAFLASATCTPGRTAVVAALSLVLGLYLVLINDQDQLSNGVRVAVLLLAGGLAPFVARLREEKTQLIVDLTRVARVAQDAVLTPVPPTVGPLRFATVYESASREALIGGDLFAVVSGRGESRVLVGDVRGKGLDAVKTAALVLALFREASTQERSLAEVADHCHRHLRTHLGDEDFVTAVLASIDDQGRTELLSCGHPTPLLVHDGEVSTVEIPRPAGPLGLAVDTAPPEPTSLQLVPGDRLLFFTDGLIEARDDRGAFVDVTSLVNELRVTAFDEALPGVLRRLHAKAGRIDDDLALLLVEFGAPLTSDVTVGVPS